MSHILQKRDFHLASYIHGDVTTKELKTCDQVYHFSVTPLLAYLRQEVMLYELITVLR
jgi:hypothetical protein